MTKSVIFAAVLFVVFSALAVNWLQFKTERNFLTAQLRDYLIAPVDFGSRHYEIRNGRVFRNGEPVWLPVEVAVLRLARHKLWAEISAPLALEGADLDVLKNGLKILEGSLDDLAGTGKWGEDSRKLEKLHPIKFLEALARTENLRRAAVNYPDENLFRVYLSGLDRTLDLYLEELSLLQSEFENQRILKARFEGADLRGYDVEFNVLGGGARTSFGVISGAFDRMAAAVGQKRKLAEANSCFSGRRFFRERSEIAGGYRENAGCRRRRFHESSFFRPDLQRG